jgi:hypothetical protein
MSTSVSVSEDEYDMFGLATPLNVRMKKDTPGLKLSSMC